MYDTCPRRHAFTHEYRKGHKLSLGIAEVSVSKIIPLTYKLEVRHYNMN